MTSVKIVAQSNMATVTFTSSPAATATVAYGTGNQGAVWSAPETKATTKHSLILGGLSINQSYRIQISAHTKRGALGTSSGSFQTGAMPTTTKTSIVKSAINVNGQPFLPIANWWQCPTDFKMEVALGVNLFLGDVCLVLNVLAPMPSLSAALAGRAYGMPHTENRTSQTGRGIIGYYLYDEPDGYGIMPEQVTTPPSWQQSGRISTINVTDHFAPFDEPQTLLPGGRDIYPRYFAKADFIGVDFYPLSHACSSDLHMIYEEQKALAGMNPGKPTYQWIEINNLENFCPDRISAATVNAEAWLMLAGGANGVAYFGYGLQGSWSPKSPEIVSQMGATNQAITDLAPALLSNLRPARTVTGSSVLAGARRYNGASYLIVVNPGAATTTASIKLPSLTAQSATSGFVYGEGRTIKASAAGGFNDTFGPYAAHVYVFPPK